MKYIILLASFVIANAHSKEPNAQAYAEVEEIRLVDQDHAKLTLNLVNILTARPGTKFKKYYRYKDKPKENFDAKNHREIRIKRKKKKEFTTNIDTVFEAYCINSSLANKNGLVTLNLSDFLIILSKNKSNTEKDKVVHDKYGACYASEGGNLINFEYDMRVLKRVSFVWIP